MSELTQIDPNAFALGVNSGAALIDGYKTRQATQQAGDAYSTGDVTGAASILAKSGNIDGARQLNSDATASAATANANANATRKEGLTAMLNMAQGLRRVDPTQRQHAFQTVLAPLLKQQGIDDAHIQAMSQSPMDDQTLDATIQALGGEVQKLQTVAPGASLYDPASNKTVFTAPPADHWVPVPEGGSLVNTNGYSSGNAPASVAPSQGAANAAPADGTPAQRNNNPGNLKWDGKSHWQGMTGVDPAGFVQFDTPENGTRAASINLHTQLMRGPQTLTSFISRYAPASDHNDTQAYIASVAQQTGLDPTAPIPDDPATSHKIMQAMFSVESGGTPAKVPAAPAQATQPGQPGVIMGNPKPKVRPATAEEKQAYGLDPSTPAQIKPDGSIDVISGGASDASAALSDTAIDQLAQAFNITHTLPSLGMGASKDREKILNRAADMQAKAGKDGSDLVTSGATYKAAAASLSDVTKSYSRISAGEENVNSLADQLQGQMKTAGLTGQSPFFNGGWRDAKTKFAGDARMAGVVETLGTLRDDYAIVMAGSNGHGSDALRNDIDNRINAAQNVAQIAEIASQMKTSMANRKNAYLDQIGQLTQTIGGKTASGGQSGGKTYTYDPKTGTLK